MAKQRQHRGAWRVFKKDPARTKHTIEGRDHLNVKRRMPAFKDLTLSHELARYVAQIVDYKRQNAPLPPLLASWVQNLAPDIKQRLAGFGLLGSHTRPLAEHIQDYEAALRRKDNCGDYIQATITRNLTIIDAVKAVYWSDIQPSAVQRAIAEVRKNGRPLSKKTQNHYLACFKAFARWCVEDGRLIASPVECLKPLDAKKVRNDLRRERRALSVEEVRCLLKATTDGPVRQGQGWSITGP